MFKKLAHFFFREETVEVEEITPKQKKDDYEILEIKALQAKEKKAEEKTMPEPEIKLEEPRRKPVLIDLEEPKPSLSAVVEVSNPAKEKKTGTAAYQPKEVISPMLGGKAESKTKSPAPKPLKSRKPLTEVISPMYGKVSEEHAKERELHVLELVDLDLKDIITPVAEAEVQVSLFDYIDEYDDER